MIPIKLKDIVDYQVEFDRDDYPDMSDAWLSWAETDERELDESELDYINEHYSDWVQEKARQWML
jgi:hypothetical protein